MTAGSNIEASAARPAFEFFWLALLGILLGLAFLNAPGTGDTQIWLDWMRRAHDHGAVAAYADAGSDYPPLSFVILDIAAHVADRFALSYLHGVKLFLLFFTVASAALMILWDGGRRVAPGAVVFLALAVDALLLAYIDVFFVALFLVGLLCLQRGWLALGGVAFTLSALIKWQPIILAPLVLVYLLSQRPGRRGWLATIPALLAALLVYLVFGNAIFDALRSGIHDPVLTGTALNFDWLWSAAMQTLGGTLDDHGLVRLLFFDRRSPELQHGAFAALALASSALRYLCYAAAVGFFAVSDRSLEKLLQASILAFMAYFIFGHGVHENHACLPAMIAIAWACMRGERWFEAILLVVVFNANLVVFYGFGNPNGAFSRHVAGDIATPLAAFNVASYLVLLAPALRRLVKQAGALGRLGHRLRRSEIRE